MSAVLTVLVVLGFFVAGAFSAPPQFALGTSSRNPVRGPAYRNIDLAVMRDVSIRGRSTLQLRLEAFNLTNTPPPGPPNGVFGTAAFGTIATAGDPPVLQVAAKLQF